MAGRFRDLWWDTGSLTGERFALGIDEATARPYLAVPVSLQFVDIEERFVISGDQLVAFRADPHAGARHARRCLSGAEAAARIGP